MEDAGDGGGQASNYISPGHSDELVRDEQEQLKKDFKKSGDVWTGLALSGGGVRSATFCLGALQALDKAGILDRFDYQSSVSGGGFTGLSWLWYRRQQGNWGFPFREDSAHLDFLRRNIGYLNPSSKIDYFSGAVAVLRTIFLNLLVWIPIITLGFLIIIAVGTLFSQLQVGCNTTRLDILKMVAILALSAVLAGRVAWKQISASNQGFMENAIGVLPHYFFFFCIRLIAFFLGILLFWNLWIYISLLLNKQLYNSLNSANDYASRASLLGFASLTATGLIIVGLAAAASVGASLTLGRISDWLSQIQTWLKLVILFVAASMVLLMSERELFKFDLNLLDFGLNPNSILDVIVVVLTLFLILISVLAILLAILAMFIRENREYVIFRKLDETASEWAPIAIALLMVGTLPLVAPEPEGGVLDVGLFSIAALVYGTLTAIYSHYASFRNLAPGAAGKFAMMSGAAVFLYGLLLLCYYLAATANGSNQWLVLTSGIVIIATSFWALFFTNINQIGLHRYYRDRIAETFFAEQTSINNGVSGPTGEGISMTVEDLPRKQQGQSLQRPFPIVNMNAIMVDDSDTKTRLRGGANFIASPLYSGSDATGWIKTSIFGEASVGRPLHAATVAAASGAAVNSSAGYAGAGITRNRIVSIAMRLLNVRLGFWLINPHWLNKKSGGALRWITKTAPTHFRPGLVHLLSNNWKRTAKFVELSDGGHFDNLGVYELLRRRCDLILVCDGEADKETSYGGLVSVARRAREDFDAELHFEPGLGPERMVANLPLGYPSNAKAAASPYMAARVSYPMSSLGGPKDGIIIYIKATMIDDVSFVTKGYKGNNPDFPHQSTVDQFFQAEQFEAYRELGEVAATKCIREMKIDDRFDTPLQVWTHYLHDNRRSHNKKKNK
jgi:hypothetical protein